MFFKGAKCCLKSRRIITCVKMFICWYQFLIDWRHAYWGRCNCCFWQIVSFLFFQWGGGRELNLSVCCSLYNSPKVAAVRDDTMNGIINAMNNQDEPVKVLLAFDGIFRLGKTCFVPVVRNGRFAGCVCQWIKNWIYGLWLNSGNRLPVEKCGKLESVSLWMGSW